MPQMKVLGQFIRDMSFENILSRKPVEGQVQPDIQVQVALDGRKGNADNQYEVISKYNITSKNKGSEDVLFVLELPLFFGVEHLKSQQMPDAAQKGYTQGLADAPPSRLRHRDER